MQVTGRAGVPDSGVSAVVLNVTVTDAPRSGYITVYPDDGTPRPTASNLNFPPGDTRANLVTVKLGPTGGIVLSNTSGGTVQLVADVAGYFVSGAPSIPGAFASLSPTRVLDTRKSLGATGPVAPNSTIHVQISGMAGVPASGVSAVVLNVTETEAKGSGYVTVYPDQTAKPTASNLNYPKGDTRANLVTVKLGANGKVAMTNNNLATVQLVADVAGYYLAGAPSAVGSFVSLSPTRVLDTRKSLGATGPVGSNKTVYVQITTRAQVPAQGVWAVVLNVTVTNAQKSGYVTVYPDQTTKPSASNLNYPAGDTRANLVTVKLGANGKIALTNNSGGTAQLVADVAGYYRSDFHTFSGSGGFVVGTDIVAGTYRTTTNATSCYWERDSGFSGAASDIIANNETDFHDVVTIEPSDAGFYTDHCGWWTTDLSPITSSPTAGFGPGTMIVNTDIAPGVWRAAGGSSCYWVRLSGFNADASTVLANDFGVTSPTVSIQASDAGFYSEGCGTWTKIG
ncbi:MAG TPA: hypothetical protein VHO26_03600 [Propionibacteriaceae bacterium]|nr:hypothetical protein [Propionibacteriaceae bacterium]